MLIHAWIGPSHCNAYDRQLAFQHLGLTDFNYTNRLLRLACDASHKDVIIGEVFHASTPLGWSIPVGIQSEIGAKFHAASDAATRLVHECHKYQTGDAIRKLYGSLIRRRKDGFTIRVRIIYVYSYKLARCSKNATTEAVRFSRDRKLTPAH